MKPILLRAALLLVTSLPVCACYAPIQSHGEYLHTAPFAAYHTFSFATAQGAPEGYETTARSAQIAEAMKPLVAEALEARGWVQAPPGEGDIIVACGAGRRDTSRSHRVPWRVSLVTGETSEEHDFVEGGIVVDAFDKSGGQIWHGAARTEIDPAKPSLDRLRLAVDAALVHFPPKR